MLEKLRNLRHQPCCGYFLQGSARAVAIVDIGLSLFSMILIGSELAKKFQDWVDMRKDENLRSLYYTRAILWASYFAVMIVIIGLSVFLFKTARRRNSRMCTLWIYLSIAANTVLMSSTIATQILFPINPFILTFLVPYVAYKIYCIHIVVTFIHEIRSYGGFNAALSGLTDAEVEEFEKGDGADGRTKRDDLALIKGQAFNKDFEVGFDQLEIDDSCPLGKGAFGTVYRAKMKIAGEVEDGDDESGHNKSSQCVAVKTVHQTADPAYFKTLLAELKIMTFLPRNENVVNLVGACTSAIKEKRLYIIVEFCPFGNVHDYLKARRGLFVNYVGKDGHVKEGMMGADGGELYRNITTTNSVTTGHLLQWAYETGKGMQFLEDRKVIHGDLAARNLLLGYQKSIKITDFGLSKKLYQYTDYVKKQDKLLPWRWLAIESLQDMKFSSKSDVWSYGVTIWELFSLSEVPFPGFSWTIDFIEQVRDHGLRMKQPHNAPNDLYDLMLRTWHLEEDERPNFGEIINFFEKSYHLPIPSGVNDNHSNNEQELSSAGQVGYETLEPHPPPQPHPHRDEDEVEVYIGNVQQLVQEMGSGNNEETNTCNNDISGADHFLQSPLLTT